MKKKMTLPLLLLITMMGYGQGEKDKRLEQFIDKILTLAPQVPGISVLVTNADSVLFTKGFGWADVENRTKATAETGFYIASATKPFVAFLGATLAEQGKINLRIPIIEYAPFKNFKDKTLFKNITILDLLTHQSGLENDVLSFKLAYSGDYTPEMIVNLIEKYTTANKEGKAFKYTNFGYYLFAILLKDEFGLEWRDLLHTAILEPLAMTNTTAYASIAQQKEIAKPYDGIITTTPQRAFLTKTDNTMHAAGGIITTANDMGKWLMFQLNLGMVQNTQLYPRGLLETTQARQLDAYHNFSDVFEGQGYALGWRTGKFKDTPLVYHFGGYRGFFSHVSFLPAKRIGVAVFVNHELGSVPGNLIAEYAYDLYTGNTSALKAHEKYIAVTLPKLIEKSKKEEVKSREHFAKRLWQLTLPKNSYAGTYFNAELGTITVEIENEEIKVASGNTKATATAMELDDVIRIELIPGEGMTMRFIVKNEKVEAIKFMGVIFTKKL